MLQSRCTSCDRIADPQDRWCRACKTPTMVCEVSLTAQQGVSLLFVTAIRYTYNITTTKGKLMTITYSIWQGSRLLSIDNVATEIKAIDHLIKTLNDSELGKKVKFSANIQSIKVGE